MARIKRHAAVRRLSRRSREEKRRLSEGGGGIVRVEETPEPDYGKQDPQIDVTDLEITQIDKAYSIIFEYDEVETSLLMRELEIVEAVNELKESKGSLDDKILALKRATRSPDSDNVKRINGAIRRSLEMMDSIGDLQKKLEEVKLQQTSEQVRYRTSLFIVDENLSSQEENQGLLLGFLGHVWRVTED